MKISEIRLVNIRCFDDADNVKLSDSINIVVGKNNSGKSTFLKSIIGLQMSPFDGIDIRPHSGTLSYYGVKISQVKPEDPISIGWYGPEYRIIFSPNGEFHNYTDVPIARANFSQCIFTSSKPNHVVVPFLAKRQSVNFSQDVSISTQNVNSGDFTHLYGKIDLLATYGHPLHGKFKESVVNIIGLPITMRASAGGKVAGFYFDTNTFVTLDRMGDGVTEMVALIVELCTESGKIFVLEEPESNLHPKALKSLLDMIRASSSENQFFISTHSNIVVRELGAPEMSKILRVYKENEDFSSPSKIEEVENDSVARTELLRELGYEFTDFDLHEGWLFLEESSAETIITEILIPAFTPSLRGKIRTFAAGGASNLSPSLAEFQRLIVFIHLQPVYRDRIWIRADGDAAGKDAISIIRKKFDYFNDTTANIFSRTNFELYYPKHFLDKTNAILSIQNKQQKASSKFGLLKEVTEWTRSNSDNALEAWSESASEIIDFLKIIEGRLLS